MANKSENDLIHLSLDELKKRYTVDDKMAAMFQCPSTAGKYTISGLSLYPIKSCAPQFVSKWPIGPRGFLHDRLFCIYSKSMKRHLAIPRQTAPYRINPFIDLEKGVLIMACDGMDTNCIVPIETDEEFDETKAYSTMISGERTPAILEHCGEEARKWIVEAMDIEDIFLTRVRSFRLSPIITNRPDDWLTLTADSHLQLVNTKSVEQLAEEIAAENGYLDCELDELCMKFRPNIIINGESAYEEEKWNYVAVNNIKMQCLKTVARCNAVNFDAKRLEYVKIVLPYLNRKYKGEPIFGINANIRTEGQHSIEIGQTIQILNYNTN